MGWDFETDPAYQAKLDWADEFVREEVEPLDLLWPGKAFTPPDDTVRKVITPLKEQVRRQGLWATHLGPELGGQGHGQLQLSLLNEILGRSQWAPIIFGCQAPDTGNAEIIAHYGTEEQKERYLRPLLEGEVFSCYSMTEPQGGSDPTLFTTRAVKDGDEWVINGWKYFSSNARTASFLIVMAVTDPDVSAYQGMSMFLVPTDTPGVEIVRNVGPRRRDARARASHALIHYDDVRVPADALLGGEGQAFAIAQTRLGGGRIHHAMRTIGMAKKGLDMMCERALSREAPGGRLADKQFVQGYIADSYAQLTQFRLFVLYTAWSIDKHNDYRKVRKDIAAVKVLMPDVLHDIAWRAIQVHGALGVSNEMPFTRMMTRAPASWAWPTVPPRSTRSPWPGRCCATTSRADDLWPTKHLPKRLEAARAKFAERPRARGGEPLMIDTDRLATWLDGQDLPGKGEPIEAGFVSGGTQNEIYEIRRGDLHGALRIPPPARPRPATTGSCASGASSRRSTAPTCRTPRPSPLRRPLGARPDLLPDGLRRRLVADEHRDGWPAPFDTDLEARRGLAYELVEGIALLVQGRLAGQGPGGPRSPRRLPRAPGRPVDRVPRADQGPRAARGSTRRRRGCGRTKPIDYVPGLMHGDYQFANVMYRHGAPARLAAIVDWEMGTVGDPKLDLGWVVQRWPEQRRRHRQRHRLRRHDAACRSRSEVLAHYAEVSGRQVDDIDYYVRARQVEARHRARAGLPAGRRRPEAAGVRAGRARPDARAPPSWRRRSDYRG